MMGNMHERRPLIFSGTTEGRRMSERLSAAGVDHIVCVATGYGELVMKQDPHADVRQGRLGADEMTGLISGEAGTVFDATHPYASAVSENIREACSSAGAEYVRILRGESRHGDADDIRVFADAAECADALRETKGNVLLTTGSKDLGTLAADPEVRRRLYARVLPSEESLALCKAAGLQGRQVIAMQGPFSREMDLAVIRQYDIQCLVTKSSGTAGGFEGKLGAAAEAGIPVYIIGRPSDEEGISVSEALENYFGIAKSIHIDLVGTGPGRPELMTAEARDAVRSAEIIFGAARMTEPYRDHETYPYYLARDIIPVIAERRPERIAILFSGDTGYCSGADKMKPELEKWLTVQGYSYRIDIHPGISSIAYLAAKTGVSYTGAVLKSMHGRSGDAGNMEEILNAVRAAEKTFLIFSGPEDVRKLGQELINNGLAGVPVILGRQLSYPEESIETLMPADCLMITEKGLYAAIVINEERRRKVLIPALGDDEFIRGKVPMTKESIRHLSVLRLGLECDSVVYDVGSGTGSVACEIAGLSRGIRVFAIEKNDEACELIRGNAEALHLRNIELVKGEAPDVLADLPAPTHVFIGGSSGRLREITETLRSRIPGGSGIRVVINAVSLETIAEINDIIRETGVSDVCIEQVSVSRARAVGNHHLMTAENPVIIASFTLKGHI